MPRALRWSWEQVNARRMRRQGLLEPLVDTSAAAVVAAMCGAHAQVLTAAEWSIGSRLVDATQADVRAALWDEHSLIKTFGPRGTVHLLAARDLPMWCGALSALGHAPGSYPDAAYTEEETDALVAAMGEVLADAELTSAELTDALVSTVGVWARDPQISGFQQDWPRWRLAIYAAAYRGAICFGPNKGRNVTYTSPRRWLPDFAPLDGDAAVGALIDAYLRAYGPATPQHFARWMAAQPRWAAEHFEALDTLIEPAEVDGVAAFIAAGDSEITDETPRGVRLLPYFDAFGIASQPRELLFPGRATERALARGQAGNYPLLLVDGIVAGVWHQRRSGKRIAVTVEPLGKLTAMQRRELDAEVERYAAFAGGQATLTIGPVTAGPHA